MEIPPNMPPEHEVLCGCMHVLSVHEGPKGKCKECDCQKFHFEGQAQLRILNPMYRAPGQQPSGKPTTEVPLLHLKPKQPPIYAWWSWHRNWLRKWLRDIIGVTEDMENGTLYMKLTTSNIMHQAQLLQGLRADIDAANNSQNPLNEEMLEIRRRLQFYESEVGTGLALSYKKLMKIDEKQRERDAKAAAMAELEAANKRIEERKSKIQTGEFIECPSCHGGGCTDDGQDTCPECGGPGVVPNPEYKPESEFTDDGVKRHLTLE